MKSVILLNTEETFWISIQNILQHIVQQFQLSMRKARLVVKHHWSWPIVQSNARFISYPMQWEWSSHWEVKHRKYYTRAQCRPIRLCPHLNRSLVTIRLRSSVTAIPLLYHKMTATQWTWMTAGDARQMGVERWMFWWWKKASSATLCDFWMANRAQSPNQSVKAFSL